MKKQIFAVCDLEAEYARNFMEYLNRKNNLPFEVQAFTSVQSLIAYAKETHVELLLISADAMCDEVRELDISKTVILTEGTRPEELDTYAEVYKYQSSAEIVREVMACYGEEKTVFPMQNPALKRKTELFGVYSPLGRCLKTSFAWTLGQILSEERSVLLISLEEYSGLEKLMQKKFSCTLSDLLYYVRQKNPGVILKLNSMVQSVGQLDFVPPVQSPEDIRGTSWKDWEYLLQELILHGTYEAVVIDMGNGIEELFQMLDLCKFIYMPICVDPVSKSKIRQFENLLNARDYSEVSEKTVKMKLPFCTVESVSADYPQSLVWSTLGDYVRELLGKGLSYEQ